MGFLFFRKQYRVMAPEDKNLSREHYS